MEEKKNNKGIIWVIIILIFLILGLIGYIVYDKVVLENNSMNNNVLNNTTTTTTTIKNQETLTEEEINKYLSYVPFSLLHEDAYHSNSTNINNVNKAAILFTVFHHDSLENSTYGDNENCFGESCIIEESFNKKLEEMYNVKIDSFKSVYVESEKWKNFESYLLLKEGHYFELGYGGGKYKSQVSNISSEILNEQLIIYEQIGIIVQHAGEVNVYNGGKSIKEYTHTSEGNFDGINLEELAEQYVKDNINEFNKYKHIFKKNSDGTYYWYSTEVVK